MYRLPLLHLLKIVFTFCTARRWEKRGVVTFTAPPGYWFAEPGPANEAGVRQNKQQDSTSPIIICLLSLISLVFATVLPNFPKYASFEAATIIES